MSGSKLPEPVNAPESRQGSLDEEVFSATLLAKWCENCVGSLIKCSLYFKYLLLGNFNAI